MKPNSWMEHGVVDAGAAWLRPSLGLLWTAWLVLLPGSLAVIGLLGNVGLARWWFLSSVALSLAAAVHWLARRKSPTGRFVLGIAVGMGFGCLADAYGVVPKSWRIAESLTVIMALFALGHVFYIVACWELAGRLCLRRRGVWLASLGLWTLIGVGLWGAIASWAPNVGVYRWPSLGYSLLLSSTAGAMTSLAVQHRRFCLMAIGAALFLASDALLAVYLFHAAPQIVGAAVWLTYGVGQMLIVYGAAAVSGLTREGMQEG
jgi:uncharacterized membrane protein YhhN